MKLGFLITARLKSSRLPYKILLDLHGKTVIERIIDRAKNVHNISEIVICTSINPQDKPLVDIAKKNEVYYFNGNEEDVLNRLLNAAEFFDLDYFVGITADNPLFSVYHTNLIVDEIQKNDYDFIKTEGLPFGTATYIMSVKALKLICKIKNIVDTEIWGPLINRPELFNIKSLKASSFFSKPHIRLTLDYYEDYELINNLYKNIEFRGILPLFNVIKYLEDNQGLLDINTNCIQKELDETLKSKIEENFKENFEEILRIKEEIYNS